MVIPQCFSPEDVHHARDLVMYFIRKEGKKATHFHGADDSRADLQVRSVVGNSVLSHRLIK